MLYGRSVLNWNVNHLDTYAADDPLIGYFRPPVLPHDEAFILPISAGVVACRQGEFLLEFSAGVGRANS